MFEKYIENKDKLKNAKIVLPTNGKSLMQVYLSKQATDRVIQVRPHSYLWTNGSQILYREIPQELSKLNEYFGVYNTITTDGFL